MIKRILIAVIMTAILTSCGQKPKVLILYYSLEGSTSELSRVLNEELKADICWFDIANPYFPDYDETIERCLKERAENYMPKLAGLQMNPRDYDVIFLGYPIWFGSYATPVKALLNECDFSGKTIVPFCTYGSGGLQSSTEDLRKALPDSKVLDGFGVRGIRVYDPEVKDEARRFLIENGWVEGHVEALPEFSQPTPVNEDDVEIFTAACGNYKFPLGTPETICSRFIPGGCEYRYVTSASTMDGKPAKFTIFVSVFEGKDPVFTQVIR